MDLDSYRVTSVDFSSVLIDKLSALHAGRSMVWQVADVRNLPFESNSFELVVDKATLDSMMTAVKDPWVSRL